MSVRATSLAFLFGAMVIGGASAAERPGTPVPPVPTSNDAPVASEVRLGGDDTQTRLVVDLSQKIDVRAFTLANPYRVVMDMPQITFRLPPKTGEAGRGLIKAFRFGLVMQGGSRIVIDLARPARIDKAFVIDAANDQPARLVVDLAASDREAFMRTIAVEGRPLERKPEPPAELKLPSPDPSVFTQKVPERPPAAAQPQQMAALSAPRPARREATSQPQALAQPQATLGSSSPGYKPPEPDLSVKYNVMLGLPPELPPPASSSGQKADDGYDATAVAMTADVASSVVAEFRRHLKTCSKLPASVEPSDHIMVRLRVFMTPDGKLAGAPAIGGGSATIKAIDLMQSAIDALKACQPYTMLPADRYGEWKALDLIFTPKDFAS